MPAAPVLPQTPGLSVVAYRCDAGPGSRPYWEAHRDHSLSAVRRGSFGLTRGRPRS